MNLMPELNTYLKGFFAINSYSGIVNAISFISLRIHIIHYCSLLLCVYNWHVKPTILNNWFLGLWGPPTLIRAPANHSLGDVQC
jgi:hypothetical protein